jgi:hypothetical protein
MMDDKHDNEGSYGFESNYDLVKYPFSSNMRVEQPDNFMSVKKFSNFFGVIFPFGENDADTKISETLFTTNYLE